MITEGNRCALVVGVALNIKPSGPDISFKGQPSAAAAVRNQPFASKFFLKADQLARRIAHVFGRPDIECVGSVALSKISGLTGVVFCEDCWRSPSEKVKAVLHISSARTGDHIDVWNGKALEIYDGDVAHNVLVSRARQVRFWIVSDRAQAREQA
jgi:hypothetical protein